MGREEVKELLMVPDIMGDQERSLKGAPDNKIKFIFQLFMAI